MRGTFQTRFHLGEILAGCLLLAGPLVAAGTAGFVLFENDYLRLTYTSEPTPNQPGWTTSTLTARSKTDAQITGFDFFGSEEEPWGFFGPLGQVNPAGWSTVFNDYNSFMKLLGASVLQDSQFLFDSSSLIVVPNTSTESNMHLRAAAMATTPLGKSVRIAQIVTNSHVRFEGAIQFEASSGIASQRVTNPCPCRERIFGDYNVNGVVDAADYGVWRDNFGASSSSETRLNGDGNADGNVDASDYLIWRDNLGSALFGASANSIASGAQVPEPSSLALLLILLLGLSDRRKKILTQRLRGAKDQYPNSVILDPNRR